MKQLSIMLLGPAMLFGCLSCGNSNHGTDSEHMAVKENKAALPQEEQKDARFVVAAASGGMLEVRLGELAVTKAADSGIKEFGKSMVDDHTVANKELAALAGQKNITLPAMPGNDAQAVIDDLAKRSGADFDKAYIAYMVKDHKEDIDAFDKEAKDGHDADLKSWATGKLPLLEHHLMMAETLRDRLK